MALNLTTRKPAVPGKPKNTKIAEPTAMKVPTPGTPVQRQVGFRKQTQEIPAKTKPQDAMQGTRLPGRWNLPATDVATAGYSSYQRFMPAPVKTPRSAIPVAKPQHLSPKKSKGSKELKAMPPKSKSPSPEKSNRNKSFFDKYLKFAYDLSTPEGVRQLEAHFFPTDKLADQPSTSKCVPTANTTNTTTTNPNNIAVCKQINSTKDPRTGKEEPTKRENSIETILERSKFY